MYNTYRKLHRWRRTGEEGTVKRRSGNQKVSRKEPYLVREVFLDQVEGSFVDHLVLVILQSFDLDDEDDLAVLGGEEVQQRLQDVGLHQVDHLLHRPPAGEYNKRTRSSTSTSRGTSPASMTSWIWVSLPAVTLDSVQAASFWMLAFLWRSSAGNMARAPESSTACVCSSVPVTMFPRARSAGLLEPEQLDEAGDEPGLHHDLDAVVGAVRQVGHGPAGVSQHLPVLVVQQTHQHRQDLLDGCEGGGRVLVPAEVREGPGHVPQADEGGDAPPSTTAAVCSEVPEAMLVRAQDASNCMGGESTRLRKDTNLGIRPALISWLIGGFFSRERSFL
ncbi:hypothetical protein F7725_003973 [Dissostichus mawsoni]|uniref:Uncharacterized protein n=1 Tax=Dissostichus mawsoni TaxID=36200 RepID=A0A7J5YBU9_DISMA|nr:hypothetical protein F7725_003973 [Dissostichus mawsoni]